MDWGRTEKERQCRYLRNDDRYSQLQCQKQCQAAIILASCSCLPWHLSRVNVTDRDASICSGPAVACYRQVQEAATLAPGNFDLAESILIRLDLGITLDEDVEDKCDCPQPCDEHVTFTLEVSGHVTSFSPEVGNCSLVGDDPDRSTKLEIDLDLGRSERYLRRATMTWETLLGLVGGVMALLIGFSLVSLVECCYFLTFRWWQNARDPVLKAGRSNYELTLTDEEQDWMHRQSAMMRRSASNPDFMRSRSRSRSRSLVASRPVTGVHFQSEGVRKRNGTAKSVGSAKPESAKSVKSEAKSAKRASRPPTATSELSGPPPSRSTSVKSVRAPSAKKSLNKSLKSVREESARSNGKIAPGRTPSAGSNKSTIAWE